MEKIYFIKSECNDHGWLTGYYYFKNLEDAITTMRRYVAHKIRHERGEGNKILKFKVWRDSVMDSTPNEESISITFNVKNKDREIFYWDFRIWCADLLDEPLAKDKCFNF